MKKGLPIRRIGRPFFIIGNSDGMSRYKIQKNKKVDVTEGNEEAYPV